MALRQHLVRAYLAQHPLEAARTMETLEADELAGVLADADAQTSRALHLMDPAPLAAVLDRVATEEAGRLLRLMTLDTQLAVLPLMETPAPDRALAVLDPGNAELLQRLLSYPKQTAASLVEYDTFRVPADITTGEALDRSRRSPSPVRYYVYVTDRDNRLVGVVSLKQLLRSAAGVAVSEIMHQRPARIAATDTASEVTDHYEWRRFPMLPVVDADERLVGVILYETIQRLREEGVHDSGWAGTRSTLMALSEVYWLGLSTALGSAPQAHDED